MKGKEEGEMDIWRRSDLINDMGDTVENSQSGF